MAIFHYDENAVSHLKNRDPKLGVHIDRIGLIEREMTHDLFESLVYSIVSQQISGKAAVTVCGRIRNVVGDITPAAILALSDDNIRKCGISGRKVSYIKSTAQAFQNGVISTHEIVTKKDEEIIKLLDDLPGIGRWTAEMLLIFSLGRQDILSYDDLGIRRGIERVHNIEKLGRQEFTYFRRLYSPYSSVASFYLWHIASE